MKSITKKTLDFDREEYRESVFARDETPLDPAPCDCALCAFLRVVETETGEKLRVDPHDPDIATALCRCANWRAKFTGDYEKKVSVFLAAAELRGISCGWELEEGVFYISGPLGPAASAHDPYDQLWEQLNEEINNMRWDGNWDGLVKQPLAWFLLQATANIKKRVPGWSVCEACKCPRSESGCAVCDYNEE